MNQPATQQGGTPTPNPANNAQAPKPDDAMPTPAVTPVGFLTPADAVGHKYWLMLKQIHENMHEELWQALAGSMNLDRANQGYTIRMIDGNLAVYKIDKEGNIIE